MCVCSFPPPEFWCPIASPKEPSSSWSVLAWPLSLPGRRKSRVKGMNGKGWKGGAKGRRVSPKGIEEKVSLWHRAKKTDGPEDQPKTRKRKGAKKAAVKDCARVYVREVKSPSPPLRTTVYQLGFGTQSVTYAKREKSEVRVGRVSHTFRAAIERLSGGKERQKKVDRNSWGLWKRRIRKRRGTGGLERKSFPPLHPTFLSRHTWGKRQGRRRSRSRFRVAFGTLLLLHVAHSKGSRV